MTKVGQSILWLALFVPFIATAQIDPYRRDLVQLGYHQALEGHAPFASYAFYYHNQPDFLRTNLTLRLALAPVYLDFELGFVNGLGPNTDFALAMELSAWYEGPFRTDSGLYGFGGDREVEPRSHLFWLEAALTYTLPKSQQNLSVRLIAGSSLDADRFSAYRLGGFLPLGSEFPLSVPGDCYQEISARQFALRQLRSAARRTAVVERGHE